MANPALSTYWPLFDLTVRTPRLELRVPDDEMIPELARVAAEGVHDPAFMPFSVPWTDVPSPEQERNSLQHFWLMRAQWKPDDWHLGMAVLIDGQPVGMQGANAKQFAARRIAGTGSWLSQRVQGQGYGKEMRAAILHLLFDGLGAVRCESGAYHDNAASFGVSRHSATRRTATRSSYAGASPPARSVSCSPGSAGKPTASRSRSPSNT